MFRYLFIDIKMLFRVPLSVFFTLVYPLLMMFVIVMSYGNVDIGGGYHLIDKYFMIAVGMGILPLALISYPVWLGNSFENLSVKRLKYFGVPKSRVVICDAVAHFVLAAMCLALTMIVADLAWGLRMPDVGHFVAFLLQYTVAIVVALTVGALFAVLFRSAKVLLPLGLTTMFLMYMLCGAFIQSDQLPQSLRNIAKFVPMDYAMNDFLDIWMGKETWNSDFLLLSCLYLAVIVLVLVAFSRRNERSITIK